MPKVQAGECELFYQRMGDGSPTVVFIHGLVMDNLSSWWYTVANAIARYADVICYDLRGHGLSDRPSNGYRVEDAVEDLTNLVSALGIEHPVHIVGNSYGGVVGLATASKYPDFVESLFLVEAHAAVVEHSERKRQQLVHGLDLAGIVLTDDDVNEWLTGTAGRKLNRMARSARALIHDTTLVGDLRESSPFTQGELKAVRCACRLVYGEHSDIVDRGDLLARLLPQVELCIVPDVDHSVLMEATRQVRELVSDWILKRQFMSVGEPSDANSQVADLGLGK